MARGAQCAWTTRLGWLLVVTGCLPVAAQFVPLAGIALPDGVTPVLTIQPDGRAGEVHEVYATTHLREAWRIVGRDLRPDGDTPYDWTAPPEAGRFFAVGRADQDAEADGLPDARALLVPQYRLPATNRYPWGRAGLPTPPPAWTNIIDVKADYGAYGDGNNEDTKFFELALAAAPSGTVVYVPPGIYRLRRPLYLKSHTVLRGAGPETTILRSEYSDVVGRSLGITRWDSDQTNAWIAVTGAVARWATHLPLAHVSGLAVGDIVQIEQENEPEWGLNDDWQLNLPGQINRLLAVDPAAAAVELERPLRFALATNRNPVLRKLVTINQAGIEDLTLVRISSVPYAHSIELKFAYGCWIRNVHSLTTQTAHVKLDRSLACEVRASLFYDGRVFGGGGEGYGVSLGRHVSDCLIEDNILRRLRHALIVSQGAGGNVFGYNYSYEPANDPPLSDLAVHGNFANYNLFEGNWGEYAALPDWFEPAGPGNTLYRNRLNATGAVLRINSPHQHLVGNEIPAGVADITSNAAPLTAVANVWAAGPVCDSNECAILPESLYRSTRPAWFPADDPHLFWPPFGPERVATPSSIPAKLRAE